RQTRYPGYTWNDERGKLLRGNSMVTKRQAFFALAIGTAIGTVIVVPWIACKVLTVIGNKATPASLDLVEMGMNQGEVTEVLGPADYVVIVKPPWRYWVWRVDDEASLVVQFDGDSKVDWKTADKLWWGSWLPRKPSAFEKVRKWAERWITNS